MGFLHSFDVDVQVLLVVKEGWQSSGSSRAPLGQTAVVRIIGTTTDIILNTNRTQTFDPDIFTGLGINPMTKDYLIVKSTNHFYSAFATLASDILYVQIEGLSPYNPKKPRTHNYPRNLPTQRGLMAPIFSMQRSNHLANPMQTSYGTIYSV